MKTPTKKTRVKKERRIKKEGYIIAVGLASKERKSIKMYLTKKRAMKSKFIEAGGSKFRIIRATLTYCI